MSNACACPDLAEDSIVQVSFLHHDAALIFDEIDRMQHELNDLEYAIRTFIDVEVSPEQKQNKKFPKLGNLKDILMIELSGGGKRKKKSALPDNQTLINGFFSVDGIKHANSLLADVNKVPSSFRDTCKTQFLSESAVNILGCNYMLLEAQEQPPPDDIFHMWPFKCVTFDQLLVDIAKSITTAAVSHAASTSYFCANSEGSGSKGFHWVSAIISIDFGEVIAAIPPLVYGLANDEAGHSQLHETCADIVEDDDVITDADEAELSSDDGEDLDSVSHQSYFDFDTDPDVHSDLDLRSDAMINSSSSGNESDNDDIFDVPQQLSSSFDLERQFSDD